MHENVVVAVHCEDDNYFKKIVPRNLYEYHISRQPLAEVKSVESALRSDLPKLHICHISTSETLDVIRKFKINSNVTTEVTPHHLFLNYKSGLENFGKVNPPLRTPDDNIALWNAFVSGEIDILASDHAPHTINEKKVDFQSAPAGMPGVETMVPLLLMKLRLNKITISRFTDAVCENPAELFALKKGKIEIGYDADIIVINMRNVKKIKYDMLHTKCCWTPFEGMDAIFPTMTMVRGNIVVEDYELVASKGIGKFVHGNN
jgi:dihydroorotase